MMLPVQKIGLVPINGRYDLRLTLQPGTPEQHWNPKMHTEIPMPGGHLAWGDIPEAGTVKFGIWCDRSEDRPGHGGYWSSRAGVVGPMINKKLVWLGINNMSMHMTVEKVEELLKEHGFDEEYHIVEVKNNYGGSEEISYYIEKK